jgi:hypothetical protein
MERMGVGRMTFEEWCDSLAASAVETLTLHSREVTQESIRQSRQLRTFRLPANVAEPALEVRAFVAEEEFTLAKPHGIYWSETNGGTSLVQFKQAEVYAPDCIARKMLHCFFGQLWDQLQDVGLQLNEQPEEEGAGQKKLRERLEALLMSCKENTRQVQNEYKPTPPPALMTHKEQGQQPQRAPLCLAHFIVSHRLQKLAGNWTG